MCFGTYFKDLRLSKHFTQQQIADVIGKSKMLVSGIENGKNSPFSDCDLEKISEALRLTKSERSLLYKKAAMGKGVLPQQLFDYLQKNGDAYQLLEMCAERDIGNPFLAKAFELLKETND